MKELLHLIGNAHIDSVWLWQWTEGYETVVATFRSILNLMEEVPEFTFTASSAAHFEWLEKDYPDLFNEVRRRVEQGRWEIVGGWWVEADTNLPAGESLVRQALYGQRYFQKNFGITPTIAYNIDSFGHSGMLPQILAKAGFKYYVFMRPDPQEKSLPEEIFWWESPDGSRVLCLRVPNSYVGTGEELGAHLRNCYGKKVPGLQDAVCFYGVGDHGGGPTSKDIETILHLRLSPDFPDLQFSTLQHFFDKVASKAENFPVVHGDLQHHARGCYSVHSSIKRWNRYGEHLLMTSEKFSTISHQLEKCPYPEEDFLCAWKNLLFCQFHDILAGSSISEAYDEVRDMLGLTNYKGGWILNSALHTLSQKINTEKGEGSCLIVFNPNSWNRTGPVEVEMEGVGDSISLLDTEGNPRPAQTLSTSSLTCSSRRRIVFIADIPALGYQCYYPVKKAFSSLPLGFLNGGNNFLENDFWRLEMDSESGNITRLYDKQNGVEILKSPGNVFLVINDLSDTWSHGMNSFSDIVGMFKATSIHLEETGPVRICLKITSQFNLSYLEQYLYLYRNYNLIESRVRINWQEQRKMLKLGFSFNLAETRMTTEIPYGCITRPANGEEEPGQQWLDITGVYRGAPTPFTYGVSLLNDSKYAYDARGTDVHLTILRSPIYAHDQLAFPQPGRSYRFIDQGWQEFRWALIPHRGEWSTAGTANQALEFNVPFLTVRDFRHPGPLPSKQSFLEIFPKDIFLTVLKKAEDSSDLILRGYETSGKKVQAQIRLSFLGIQQVINFRPFEIKTFRLSRKDGQWAFKEVDFLE